MANKITNGKMARAKCEAGIYETEPVAVAAGSTLLILKSDADLSTVKSRKVVISAAFFVSLDGGKTWEHIGAFCHFSGHPDISQQFSQIANLGNPSPPGMLAKAMFAVFISGPVIGMTLVAV